MGFFSSCHTMFEFFKFTVPLGPEDSRVPNGTHMLKNCPDTPLWIVMN